MHHFPDVKTYEHFFEYFFDWLDFKITGMNPKASFEIHTLRLAGWFNLPIPIRFAPHLPGFAFGIEVSP
jgi:hypothetical protein